MLSGCYLAQQHKTLWVGVETDLQNAVPDWLTLDRVKSYVRQKLAAETMLGLIDPSRRLHQTLGMLQSSCTLEFMLAASSCTLRCLWKDRPTEGLYRLRQGYQEVRV